MLISQTQVLGPSVHAWFIHLMIIIGSKFLLDFNNHMLRYEGFEKQSPTQQFDITKNCEQLFQFHFE